MEPSSPKTRNYEKYELDKINDSVILKETYYLNLKQSKEGSFGKVFFGKNLKTNEPIAAKFEHSPRFIEHEFEVYQDLNRKNQGLVLGIPKVFDFVPCQHHGDYLIIEQLGLDLEELLKSCGGKFSIKTTTMIALQILDILQFFHSASYIYVDVKPNNFLIGKGENSNRIYGVDYGLVQKYRNDEGVIRPWKDFCGTRGSWLYVSYWNSVGVEIYTRDDLLSLGHVIFKFLNGVLPWENVDYTKRFFNIEVSALKLNELQGKPTLYGNLPQEFRTYMEYCFDLPARDTPDYDFLKKLLEDVLKREPDYPDLTFDWDKK